MLIRELRHDLVAHDLGAPVAYLAAARAPERVRSLAYLEAPLFGVEVEGLEEANRRYWHLQFSACPTCPSCSSPATSAASSNTSSSTRPTRWRRSTTPTSTASRPGSPAPAPCARRSPTTAPSGRPRAKSGSARERLRVPVLALGGSACLGDIPLRSLGKVADRVEGGTIDRCGHWIPEERPDELARRVLAFWDGLDQ